MRAQRFACRRFPAILTQDDLQDIALTYLEQVRAGRASKATNRAVLGVLRQLQRRVRGQFRTTKNVTVVEATDELVQTPTPQHQIEALEVWARLPTELWPVARLWAQDYTDEEAAAALGVTDRTIRRWRVRAQKALGADWP